jgi:hypothetical protein
MHANLVFRHILPTRLLRSKGIDRRIIVSMAEGDLDACSPMCLLREASAGMARAQDTPRVSSARAAQLTATESIRAAVAMPASPGIDSPKGIGTPGWGAVAGESRASGTAGVNGDVNESRAPAHWPRISLYHGRADKTVSWRHSESFSRALRTCGAPHVSLTIYDGKSHTDPILEDPLSGNDQLLRSLLGILRSDASEPDAAPPWGAYAAPTAGCVHSCDEAAGGAQRVRSTQGSTDCNGRPTGGCAGESSCGAAVLLPARQAQMPGIASKTAAMARQGAEPILLPRAVPAFLVELARIVNPF